MSKLTELHRSLFSAVMGDPTAGRIQFMQSQSEGGTPYPYRPDWHKTTRAPTNKKAVAVVSCGLLYDEWRPLLDFIMWQKVKRGHGENEFGSPLYDGEWTVGTMSIASALAPADVAESVREWMGAWVARTALAAVGKQPQGVYAEIHGERERQEQRYPNFGPYVLSAGHRSIFPTPGDRIQGSYSPPSTFLALALDMERATPSWIDGKPKMEAMPLIYGNLFLHSIGKEYQSHLDAELFGLDSGDREVLNGYVTAGTDASEVLSELCEGWKFGGSTGQGALEVWRLGGTLVTAVDRDINGTKPASLVSVVDATEGTFYCASRYKSSKHDKQWTKNIDGNLRIEDETGWSRNVINVTGFPLHARLDRKGLTISGQIPGPPKSWRKASRNAIRYLQKALEDGQKDEVIRRSLKKAEVRVKRARKRFEQ